MKRMAPFSCMLFAFFVTLPPAGAQEPRSLDIYFLDMVGGASTLIVTPLGESVLIDTGSLRPEHRDADRILRACEDAKLKQIDHLITTHFHSDHFGALLEVAQRIPVKRFLDKGSYAPAEDGDNRWSKGLYELYEQATKGNVTTIRAGDDIPLKNHPMDRFPALRLHCVAAQKKVEGFAGDVDTPVEGFTMGAPDGTDNARSIALLLTYGPFKFFAGGDITWNVEHHLARSDAVRRYLQSPDERICPDGHTTSKVDLYQVTHHGLDLSNNPLLLKALDPTVAVAMNGPRKGIQPRTFKDLTALPGIKALYQIHYNTEQEGQYNARPEFIANPKDNPDKGEFIKASVHLDKGIFAIQVGPNGGKATYALHPSPPDLAGCTRIEVTYPPYALWALGLGGWTSILSPDEQRYLESLQTITVDDPDQIRVFAEHVKCGSYRGSGYTLLMAHEADIACYRGAERLVSFRKYPLSLRTSAGHWFEYKSDPIRMRDTAPATYPFELRASCAFNLSRMSGQLLAMTQEGTAWPTPHEWCDVLLKQRVLSSGIRVSDPVNYARASENMARDFKCPGAGQGRCHYAMNPVCKPDSPPDMVLLFETEAGWNQYGGPELFTFDHHDPKSSLALRSDGKVEFIWHYVKGGMVLLNDGTVKFIRTPEELKQLRWE